MFVFSHAAKAGEVKSYSESVVLRESYCIFVPSIADEQSLDALWEFIQKILF